MKDKVRDQICLAYAYTHLAAECIMDSLKGRGCPKCTSHALAALDDASAYLEASLGMIQAAKRRAERVERKAADDMARRPN